MTAEAASPLLRETKNDIPDFVRTYTVQELELLCQPSYNPPKNPNKTRQEASEKAKSFKKDISLHLSEVFKTGTEDAPRDQWKAHSYEQKAGIPSEPPGNSFFRADTFYRWHPWWFTGIRLFLVRLGRILAKVGHAILPPFFSVFGLSYGLGLLIDLFIVFKVTLIPPLSEEEKSKREFLKATQNYTFWQWQWLCFKSAIQRIKNDHWRARWIRFKNIVRKDGRPYRLLNDFVWFSVNLITFLLVGPLYLLLNPILNLIGFAFDTGHEFFWLGRDTQKHIRLIKKLTTQIETHEETLKANPSPEIKNEIEKLKFIREQIKIKRNEVIRRRLWISVCTALVLVGMVLVYFPPTTLPGAFFIGAGLALGAGSVFTGLGRRLYLTAETYGPKLISKFKQWLNRPKHTSETSPAPERTDTAKITLALEKPNADHPDDTLQAGTVTKIASLKSAEDETMTEPNKTLSKNSNPFDDINKQSSSSPTIEPIKEEKKEEKPSQGKPSEINNFTLHEDGKIKGSNLVLFPAQTDNLYTVDTSSFSSHYQNGY